MIKLMEAFLTSGAALVVTALGGFILAWVGLKWKQDRADKRDHELRDKRLKIEKQRVDARLNKFATLLSGVNGRFLEVSGRAQLILDNNRSGFDARADAHAIALRDWSKEASNTILEGLEEISDISEVVFDEDVEEVLDEDVEP